MTSLLLRGGTVVTVDAALGVLDDCDVLIEGEHIAEIRPNIDTAGHEVFDAGEMIVMPGLINAHLHTWETVLRGIGADWTGHEYFDVLLGRLGDHFTPHDMYLSTLLGALNQISSGCTTIFDWCHNTKTPDHSDMAVRGLDESGIRAGGYPSIAIDTEVEVSGNMFDTMKGAAQLQGTFDSIAAYEPDKQRPSGGRPDADGALSAHDISCSSMDVLQWATINNARALGLGERTGSLTPGKQADVVLLRATDLNLIPAVDPVQSIVVHANQSNVDTVLVAGKMMKKGGVLLDAGHDMAALRTRLTAACQRLLGIAKDLGHPLN